MSSTYSSRQYQSNRALILLGSPRCALCGEPGATTADHIIPVSRGGDHSIENLRPAHSRCNGSRGNRVKIRYRAKW